MERDEETIHRHIMGEWMNRWAGTRRLGLPEQKGREMNIDADEGCRPPPGM